MLVVSVKKYVTKQKYQNKPTCLQSNVHDTKLSHFSESEVSSWTAISKVTFFTSIRQRDAFLSSSVIN